MRALIAGVLAFCACLAMAGQEAVPGRSLAQPPKIDGTIGPDEWRDAARFEGLSDQDTGAPAAEGGEFWLAYDAKFVYFAARLVDHQPDTIQATEYRTNVSLGGNDTVALSLDPFGNLADFNTFTINARGATNVAIAGGRAAKQEWLGEFLAAGCVTSDGWQVEARIPWSVMRLPNAGNHDMRFNVSRGFRRLQRSYSWAYTNGGRVSNYGRWQNVRVPKGAGRSLKLLPFGYVGNDPDSGGIANAGLDFRTELTDSLDVVGAVNPDFRNIENQVLSLDFSYFERLADESRPFFLEGSEYFTTSYDSPIFASQKVGTFDMGVKTFGKLDDKTDIGVLDAVDFTHENNLATRVHRQLTERSSFDVAYAGYSSGSLANDAVFVDYKKGFGPYSAFIQQASTHDSEQGRGDRTNAGLSYGKAGLDWSAEFTRVTADYLPRIGFAPEVDFSGFSGGVEETRPTQRMGLMETGYGVSLSHFTRIDGSSYRQEVEFSTSTTWKDGTDLDLLASVSKFEENSDHYFVFDLERPRGDSYRHWDVNITSGMVSGAVYSSKSVTYAYRPVRTLQLAGSYQAVEATGDQYDQTILSASYDLGHDRSVSGRLVRRREGTNGYVAFRRSGKGADYYMIIGDPNADKFRASLVLKVAIPFQIGR